MATEHRHHRRDRIPDQRSVAISSTIRTLPRSFSVCFRDVPDTTHEPVVRENCEDFLHAIEGHILDGRRAGRFVPAREPAVDW